MPLSFVSYCVYTRGRGLKEGESLSVKHMAKTPRVRNNQIRPKKKKSWHTLDKALSVSANKQDTKTEVIPAKVRSLSSTAKEEICTICCTHHSKGYNNGQFVETGIQRQDEAKQTKPRAKRRWKKKACRRYSKKKKKKSSKPFHWVRQCCGLQPNSWLDLKRTTESAMPLSSPLWNMALKSETSNYGWAIYWIFEIYSMHFFCEIFHKAILTVFGD